MELRPLRCFFGVLDDLSFTQPAAELHPAYPSLTRQIHDLEEEIGVCLLLQLSGEPPWEWVRIFEQERRLPRPPIWRRTGLVSRPAQACFATPNSHR
jgi:hypothetical protein